MLKYRKIIIVVVFVLGSAFLFQKAFGKWPFDINNCEKEVTYPKVKPVPFSFESMSDMQKGVTAPNQLHFNYFESGSENWPYFFIDTNIVYTAAYGYQIYPSIVWGGSNYMVVWDDFLTNYYLLQDINICCARVSREGEIIDSIRLPISSAPGHQEANSVTFNGSGYFVVWHDTRNGNYDIYGARVNLEGQVIDPEGRPIWVTPDDAIRPSVAWCGTNYLVAWEALRPDSQIVNIYGTRLSPEGEILDDTPIAISDDSLRSNYLPAIAWDGDNYLVVWRDAGG